MIRILKWGGALIALLLLVAAIAAVTLACWFALPRHCTSLFGSCWTGVSSSPVFANETALIDAAEGGSAGCSAPFTATLLIGKCSLSHSYAYGRLLQDPNGPGS